MREVRFHALLHVRREFGIEAVVEEPDAAVIVMALLL